MKTYMSVMKTCLTCIIFMSLSPAGYGQWIWARNASAPDSSNIYAGSAACDAAGNVYITGYINHTNTCTFGADTLNDSNFHNHIFLTKYDSSGNVLWARGGGAGSTRDASGTAVATDSWGNVYVAGIFTGYYLNLGDTTIYITGPANRNIFIVKYNAGGQLIWARDAGPIGGDAVNYPSAIATDAAGNLFVCGNYGTAQMIFGNDTLRYPKNVNQGGSDIFVVKYDSAGTELWVEDFHGRGNDFDVVNSCATDAQGNLIMGGYFIDSTLVFGATTLVNPGTCIWLTSLEQCVFTAKLNNAGVAQWARAGSHSGYLSSEASVCVDAGGNVFACGLFSGPCTGISFGLDSLTRIGNTGSFNMFLVKYDANGNPVWDKMAANPNYAEGVSMTADAYGHIYMLGMWGPGNISFGPYTFIDTNVVSYTADMFAVQYDNAGNVLWADGIGGKDHVLPAAVRTNGDKVYVYGGSRSPALQFGQQSLTNGIGMTNIFLARLSNILSDESVPQVQSLIGLYPNPNSGSFRLHCSTSASEVQVTICDIMGRMVRQFMAPANTNVNVELNAPNGMYFLTATASDVRQCTRFIIER